MASVGAADARAGLDRAAERLKVAGAMWHLAELVFLRRAGGAPVREQLVEWVQTHLLADEGGSVDEVRGRARGRGGGGEDAPRAGAADRDAAVG